MYYQHFGLAGAPFKFTTSPGTLYFSASHYEGLAALQWGFRERGGLMLLVGEIGTGKSTLIEWMLEQHRDERVRIALLTNPTFTFAEILQRIMSQLRIHPVAAGPRASLQALKTFLGDPAPADRVILIFDEAQGLSDEVLDQLLALSKLTIAAGQSLQIVLVGQLELEARLSDPKYQALRERIGFRSRLNPLRPGEVAGYVEHLLSIQGGRHGIFSAQALDEVARLSGGIPRMINVICHNALLLAYAEGTDSVDARHMRAAMADFRLLEEHEAVASADVVEPGAARRRGGIRRVMPSAFGLGLAAVAVAGVALAVGLRGGRGDTIIAQAGTLVAKVSERLAKPSGTVVDDRNGNHPRRQTAAAEVVGPAQLTSAIPVAPAPAPRAAAVDSANAVGHPPMPAPAAPGAAPVGRLAASSDGSLNGTVGTARDKRNGDRPIRQIEGAAPGLAESTPLKPVAPAPELHAAAVEAANTIRPPAAAASVATAPPSEDAVAPVPVASLPVAPANPIEVQTPRALAAEPAADRKIHRRRRHWRRWQLAKRATPAAASSAEGDTADNHAVRPSDAETDDSEVTATMPVTPADRGLARAETSEGDAHMARGEYGTALRKFKTALILNPNDDAVRERIDRAERGAGEAGDETAR